MADRDKEGKTEIQKVKCQKQKKVHNKNASFTLSWCLSC